MDRIFVLTQCRSADALRTHSIGRQRNRPFFQAYRSPCPNCPSLADLHTGIIPQDNGCCQSFLWVSVTPDQRCCLPSNRVERGSVNLVHVNELSAIPFTPTGSLSNSFIDGHSVRFLCERVVRQAGHIASVCTNCPTTELCDTVNSPKSGLSDIYH